MVPVVSELTRADFSTNAMKIKSKCLFIYKRSKIQEKKTRVVSAKLHLKSAAETPVKGPKLDRGNMTGYSVFTT